jgi:3-methyladenine DNA glycosylase AlkC
MCAEPFKNAINPDKIRSAAGFLAAASPEFDADRFVSLAIDGLDALELKARITHVAQALGRCLPDDWERATAILCGALGQPSDPDASASSESDASGVRGWLVWPMTEVVALRGMAQPEVSLRALHALTQRWSGEFAIRFFLLEHPELTLRTVHAWATDPSVHVRRLASEGSRPRLPWGQKLQPFVDDPSITLELLERLKDDPSEYVRRSVANHLGDIAKDHPALAVEVADRWLTDDPGRRRQVKHALRWLLKQGDAGAMRVLGYGPASVTVELTGTPALMKVGGALQLQATIHPDPAATAAQDLLVQYAVHHVRADGTRPDGPRTGKVFEWGLKTLEPGKPLNLKKKHNMKPITTRTYHSGTHRVEVQINGERAGQWDFELEV